MITTLRERVIGYEMQGEGMPLVLIHGYPLNRQIWQAQWEALSAHARVVAPDLRGFGESSFEERAMDIESYAEDIRELLEALDIHEPAVVCGLSMGGYVALAYLRRFPEHVAALVLANTKMGPDSIEGKAGRDRSIALAKEKGAAGIAEVMLPKMLAPQNYAAKPELVERVRAIMLTASVPGIIAALTAMRDRPDSTGTLLEFSTPTLIITGADDQLIPVSESEAMKQAARNSQLVILPDAGHLSCMEQPEAFNHALAEFIRALPY